ncbi:MAG: DEAD/DEAH box helicase [Opitutales bacterium]
MTFSELSLSPPLLRAVQERNYSVPTPIQQLAIPAIRRGEDVWASAQTGSGKTAAFALPILESLAARPAGPRRLRALVLAPTRELAAQIAEAIRTYGRHLPAPPKTLAVFGGVSINPQMMALRGGADLVVATPGRLLDLVAHNALSLSAVATLVLDEADRLFALGFADELARVLALLPERRQNLLFSATFPPAVRAFAEALLRNPVRLDVPAGPATTPDIVQRAIEVDPPRRTQLLRHLIQTNAWTGVLVFVATKYATEHVAEKLRKAGLTATALHGDLSQGARTQALADFKAGRVQVLLATDVAARGLDIVRLPVVVNFDLPRSPTEYLHRIGRTGRAGEGGTAVSFISAGTHAHFCLIEKRHRLRLPREQIAGFEPEELVTPATPPTGGIKGKRPSKKDKLRAAAAGQPVRPAVSAPGQAHPSGSAQTGPRPASLDRPFHAASPAELFPLLPRLSTHRPRR